MISSGQREPPVADFKGVSQAITVHGTGANAIVVDAGAGRAQLYSYSTASQTITAGLGGEQGSIAVLGGAAIGATGNITADTGSQTLITSGTLTLTGGTAPQIAPLNFDQGDCLPACASLYSGAGQQTIDADAIVIRGGASGSENLASIYSNAGQAVTVRGAAGLQILGGGESGTSTNYSNFAILENYGGSQVITFLTAGAPLTIDAGDVGQRHFAGLYNGGANTNGQQILGDPTIIVKAGTGGSGAGSANRFQLSSNFAFLASESGDQVIHATSITLQGGATDSNTADLLNWGGSMAGSALGSQVITTVGGVTLEGGTGNGANARIYSHSGAQMVSVGGTLALRRTGAGDVFLGNVFDPSAPNIDINVVEISAGTLALEGGTIWGDDGVILHLNGGSATGGSIHAGRSSALTNTGDIVVDSGTFVDVDGSLNLAGKADIRGGTNILELTGGTLSVGTGVANSGVLQLWMSNLNTPARLVVSGGQLMNASGAIVQSRSAGSSTVANAITAAIVNQGTIEASHALTLNNSGRFDSSAGGFFVAAGETLQVNAGTVRIGAGTSFGAAPGDLALNGAVLELTDNVTLTPSGAHLVLTPGTSVTSATPVTLTNQSALDLSGDTVDAAVTLRNEGTLTLSATAAAGLLQNTATGVVDAYRTDSLGGLEQAGTFRIHGSDTLQHGQVAVGSAVINSGTIELEASPSAGSERWTSTAR